MLPWGIGKDHDVALGSWDEVTFFRVPDNSNLQPCEKGPLSLALPVPLSGFIIFSKLLYDCWTPFPLESCIPGCYKIKNTIKEEINIEKCWYRALRWSQGVVQSGLRYCTFHLACRQANLQMQLTFGLSQSEMPFNLSWGEQKTLSHKLPRD